MSRLEVVALIRDKDTHEPIDTLYYDVDDMPTSIVEDIEEIVNEYMEEHYGEEEQDLLG